MKNWTIRRQIFASFAAVLALMIVMGYVAFSYFSRIQSDSNRMESDTLIGLSIAYQLDNSWLTDYDLTRQLIDADPSVRHKIEAQLAANRDQLIQLINGYEPLTTNDLQQYKRLQMVRQASDGYFLARSSIVSLVESNKIADANAFIKKQVDPQFRRVQPVIQGFLQRNQMEAGRTMMSVLNSVAAAKLGIIISVLCAVIVAIILGYSLMRAINTPLQKMSEALETLGRGNLSRRINLGRKDELGALADGFDRMSNDLAALVQQVQKSGTQVNTAATEIAANSKQQQATATEVAATTVEIGATSKEIVATSKELAKTMAEVSGTAEDSATLAATSQSSLTQMEETMHRVMAATGSVNEKLAVLNEKATNINQVVTTITKVADQTNLLSLNAAIEAEKAGEYGRGFSVVAAEIRRLADQTAVATFDIELIVKEIQSAVSSGVMGMDKFSEEVRRGMHEVQQVGAQLTQIISQVQAMAPRFEAVNEGMHVQATGAEQISQALAQLSEATHQTVESLRQSNRAIDGLNEAAAELRDGVSQFTL